MPGTRAFLFIALGLSAILLGAAFFTLPRAGAMPDAAAAGMYVWNAKGCEGCHTLYGHGGAYAPDLTQIYATRGDVYLREFLVNPAAFHPNERMMPRFGLTIEETDNLLAFLQWAGKQSPEWPPRTINVRGGGGLVEVVEAVESHGNAPDDPAARGRVLFSRTPANCATCHSLEPDVVIVGPSLAGVATRAASRVEGMSAEAYLRNSILNPGDFIVPGFPNVMAQNLRDVLASNEIDDLVAFLMTLEQP